MLTAALLLCLSDRCFAWSSRASRTENDIQYLALAIRLYQTDFGRLPSPAGFGDEIRDARIWDPEGKGPPKDAWGRPIILRVPGQHGAFDLYSWGADGIDQQGDLDDVSSWAGVNDGFYWKRHWPEGRFTIQAGIAIGTAALLLSFVFRWWTIIPLAIAIAAFGVFVGCQLLMYPGHDSTRNNPLTWASSVALCTLVAALWVFVALLRKRVTPPLEPTGSVGGSALPD